MIVLKEYETEDWVKIDDAIEPFSPLMPSRNFVEMTKRSSVAVTGVENGNVMACGGISYISKGEGIIWVKVSKKCLKQAFRWARSIRETFVLMRDSVGDLKISTYVLDNFYKGERLARLIGLKKSDETEKYKGNIYHKYTVT